MKTIPDSKPGNNLVNPPSAYPAAGSYAVPQMITLLSNVPGAVIHYTRDGSAADLTSPVFDPYRLVPMYEFGQQVPSGKSVFILHAIAVVGDQVSKERTFTYQLNPRGRDEYLSHEVAPGVRMIRDYQNDKMYLVTGSQRCLLIDAGMGEGDLRGHIEPFTHGLPIDVAITHGHPDHISKMGQFQADCDVYMNLADLPMIKMFIERMHYEINLEKIKDLHEGFVFDLGDRKLHVYAVPGHTRGCIVLLDEDNHILFSGDAIGSNQPTIVDALWLQNSESTVDQYLSTLHVFRAKIAGKVKVTFGGHNMIGSIGEVYLDELQAAAQKLVDQGTGVLTPSPRPTGVWQVVYGDRLTDPDWAAINVNKDKCLSAHPDKIASLSNLVIKGGRLNPEFRPDVFSYSLTADPGAAQITIKPTATSSRCSSLKINGTKAGQHIVRLEKSKAVSPLAIEVRSPDGTTSCTYTVMIV